MATEYINPYGRMQADVLHAFRMSLKTFTSNCGDLSFAVMLFVGLLCEPAHASFGQMTICKGLWECGIMSTLVFGAAGIPASVVIAYFVFRAVCPGTVTPRRLGLVLVMSVVCYALAVFSVTAAHQLVRVDRAHLWLFNFSAFAAFFLLYTFLVSRFFRKHVAHETGNRSD